ncbi:MAG: bifunctional aspartate kinase/homoserine dehydrogenase I, partial [Bacteroidales bacterium]|nr:bifunctional aspartate kinase/homoserine dehydrogenase I [Bacteroidales bacterium]
FDALTGISLKNSIFVDCTSSEDIVFRYPGLFKAGYSIVSCNKNPFAGPYETYKALKESALRAGRALRFETTAGAALPVVGTVQGLLDEGDRVTSIEAILSGTLAYLMNGYEGSGFDELVEDARQKGYTEPDPRTDLSGRDVLRKVLILGREAGWPLEEKDVRLEAVPSAEEMAVRYADAASKGLKLRYIASVSETSATVGLQAVGEESPFYRLGGTDNMVRILSDAYPSGITVSGSGAGPFQTAGGILHDILSIK